LFNRLRNALITANAVQTPQSPQELGAIKSGDLVEVTGAVTRSPLEEILTLAERYFPLASVGQEQRGQEGRKTLGQPQQARSTAAQLPSEIKLLVEGLRQDAERADMKDTVLECAGAGGNSFDCIVTLSKDYGTNRSFDSLLGADVSVLGKVTRNIGHGEEVNLFRRTILGYMPAAERGELLRQMTGLNGVSISLRANLVMGPCLQVLPLAVFV
jgi:hypothetical protein